MRKDLLLSLFVTITLVACNPYKEKVLKVEEGLVEDSSNISKLGISFCAPAGFKAISEEYCDSIANVQIKENPFGPKLCAIFIDTLIQNSNMSVWDVRSIPQEQLENKFDFYKQEFNQDGLWDKVERQDYRFNIFPHVIEFDMYNKIAHLKRVYFYNDNKPWFYVDYILPEIYYNDLIPFIQSSIGSFSNIIEFSITTGVQL